MTSHVPLSEFMPYGAPDLQGSAPRHLSRALVASAMLATLLFAAGGFALRSLVAPRAEAPDPRIIDIIDFPPPPVIPIVRPPQAPPGVAPTAPKPAIPIPVPDAPAIVERTIPEPGETGQPGEGTGAGREPAATGPVDPCVVGEAKPVLGVYQPVDVLPEVVRRVKPEYPGIAEEAGVEGLVLVHALVGREGSVLEARVDAKRSVPMLDEAALVAVRAWRFTPALTNGRRVAVWVAIPVRFSLREDAW